MPRWPYRRVMPPVGLLAIIALGMVLAYVLPQRMRERAEYAAAQEKAAEKKPPAAEGGLAAGAAPQVQVGQYQKYTTGPDGVANLQAAARQYSSSQGGSDADAKGGQKHIHTDKATH